MGISIAYAYYMNESDKIIPKLSEGISLLQSLAIVYLALNYNLPNSFNIIHFIIAGILTLFCGYTLYHSFSVKKHTDNSKFILSLWSSLIMLVFSILYFNNIIKLNISNETSFVAIIQCFLFGTSIIYFSQNVWLLIRFLPDKNEKTSHYKLRLKKLKNEHVSRFFDIQIFRQNALICILLVSGIYSLNYKYNVLNPLTIIWIVFTFFPIVVFCIEKLKSIQKKN